MPQGEIPIPSGHDTSRVEGSLDSWKEIATYLGRDVRTVQRWEQKEGLPVHRHMHDEKGTVFAYRSEVDEWRRSRGAKGTEGTPSKFPRLAATAVLILGVITTVPFLYFTGWRPRLVAGQPPAIRSLAVLPLQNLSGDPAEGPFADSMTEELITDLSQISALRVKSRTSVMRFKGSDKSLPEIARELNVDAIVEGSVLRSGDRVHVTAQLIYAPSDSNLWARSYDRDLKDVLALQSAVATAIASEIKIKVTPGEHARLKDVRPVSRAALNANLAGRYHLQKWAEQELRNGMGESSAEELREAVASFERAIQEDPDYASAYVGLARALLSHAPSPQFIGRADAALAKGILLDETADTHVILANLRTQYQWDWKGAEAEFKWALKLNPNSAEGHSAYADFLNYLGRMDEKKKERELAQELDPNHDRVDTAVQYVEYGFHSNTSLDEDKQYLDERAPDNGFARGILATNYLRDHRYKEAVEQYEKAFALYGYDEVGRALQPGNVKGDYKAALSEANKKFVELSKHQYIPPFLPAFLYASLENKDQAFAWLEKAYEEHDWCMLDLKHDPIWNPIRADPRFGDLVRRVGLPQ